MLHGYGHSDWKPHLSSNRHLHGEEVLGVQNSRFSTEFLGTESLQYITVKL